MTFEQFLQTKKHTNDLGVITGDDNLDRQAGFVYRDTFWIESTHNWSDQPDGKKWYLQLGNQEYLSDDIGELEQRLYDYAEIESPTCQGGSE